MPISNNRELSKMAGFLNTSGKLLDSGLNSGGGGVTVVDSDGPVALGSGSGGDLKWATKEKTLHLYNGANWIQMSGKNEGPDVLIQPDQLEIEGGDPNLDSGTTTFKAIDPDGWTVSYDINYQDDSSKKFYTNDSGNLPPHLLHPAQISLSAADSNGAKTATYRFLTSGATATGMKESDGSGNLLNGSLTARYIATDGLKSTSVNKQWLIAYSKKLNFEMTGWASYNGTYINSFAASSYTTSGIQGPTLRNGKRYMEIHLGVNTGTGNMIGFAKIGGSMGWGSTNVKQWYNGSGNFYGHGGNEQSFNLNYAQGDTIMLAWDTDNNTCWFGKNGTWGTSHNPATEAGETLPTGTLTDALCLSLSNGTGAPTMSGTVKMGPSLNYAVPAGFKSQ